MHVHLLVPDLLTGAFGQHIRLAAAEMLIARGRRRDAEPSPEAWLRARYEVSGEGDAGFAAWSLLGEGLAPGDDCWLRADPVHLRVDRDTLVLADSSLFAVSRDEAETLCARLDAHFAPRLGFAAPDPRRWYARTDRAPQLSCAPLAQARGRSVSAHLPAGADAMRWHALMNEAQMALHEHPVNEARESRGELPLNGIWFWGAGAFERPLARPFDRVFADDPVARGLALASGASAGPLPPSAAMLLESAASGQVLVVLDGLRASVAYGDAQAWERQATALEQAWFAPLLAALRDGSIGMLTLHLPATMEVCGVAAETVATDLRRFWRRPRPLVSYVPGLKDAAT